jgi:hypothetical protein
MEPRKSVARTQVHFGRTDEWAPTRGEVIVFALANPLARMMRFE